MTACNGGADVAQGDATDALEGCANPAIDDIAKWKFYWDVLLGPRITVPTTLRELHRGSYYGDFAIASASRAAGGHPELTRYGLTMSIKAPAAMSRHAPARSRYVR